MSLIEGVGDEVTALATCLLLLAIIVVAWASTHFDVRTHASIVILDRERVGELVQRVQAVAVRAIFAGETDTDVPSQSLARAEEAHSATDSLLVSGATADRVKDIEPHYLQAIGTDSHQSSDGEQRCLHESEAAGSLEDSSWKCESASASKPNTDCSESALSSQNTAMVAVSSNTPPNSIEVRLQFVDGRQRTVFADPDDTIGHFKRYNCTCIL